MTTKLKTVDIRALFMCKPEDNTYTAKLRSSSVRSKLWRELWDRIWYYTWTLEQYHGETLHQGTLDGMKKCEEKYGKPTLTPLDDYNWGYIQGMFAALNWVQGCEHGMLDT